MSKMTASGSMDMVPLSHMTNVRRCSQVRVWKWLAPRRMNRRVACTARRRTFMDVSFAEGAVTALTQELVRINTTNPPGNELEAARLAEGRLRADGFETTMVPYHDGEDRAHVVGRLRGAGERPGVLFSGHLDV